MVPLATLVVRRFIPSYHQEHLLLLIHLLHLLTTLLLLVAVVVLMVVPVEVEVVIVLHSREKVLVGVLLQNLHFL